MLAARVRANIYSMSTPEPSSDAVGFTFHWPAGANDHAQAANQIALSWDPSTQLSYLTFGNVAPPVLASPQDAADLFARTQGNLPIAVRASVVVTMQSLVQLRDFIDNHLKVVGDHLELEGSKKASGGS